ncbi:MAG: Rpn family recombination-promoting nuclease/putative transposase [Muribaculaceae bacterium]|nr:Rpn family recombination-promoting nuclease/putative transposase [Muribaculaceae bacterium]
MKPDETTFIDLRTDFGFKRLFGTASRSHILIRFINALFEGRMVITDVTFHDKEMLPQDPAGKRTIYDVYCTTDTNQHFILEMQMADSANFPKRVLFYTAAAVVAQGQKGYDYALDPIYTVIFTNFNLKHMSKRLVNEVVLKERDSDIIYSEDLQIIFISLPMVKKQWRECTTELERILYLIKNIHTMDKKSEPYRSGDYSDFFEASERRNLACEERVEYSRSYYKMIDDRAALEFSRKEGFETGRIEGRAEGRAEGREEGREEGRAEGREEGREEEKHKIAYNLLKLNIDPNTIAQASGLDLATIERLQHNL